VLRSGQVVSLRAYIFVVFCFVLCYSVMLGCRGAVGDTEPIRNGAERGMVIWWEVVVVVVFRSG